MSTTKTAIDLHGEAIDRLTERARLLGRAEAFNELRKWAAAQMEATKEANRRLDIAELNKALEAL